MLGWHHCIGIRALERGYMTQPRATTRRTRLEKQRENVLADLLSGMRAVEVAQKYKVEKSSVTRFIQRHSEQLGAMSLKVERQVEDFAIATKVARIAALNDRWTRMQDLILARATDGRYVEPGYSTGLLLHQLKSVGRGGDFRLIDHYVTDVGLLAELRQTEVAAATEMGQLPKTGDTTNIAAVVNIIRGGTPLGMAPLPAESIEVDYTVNEVPDDS